MPDAAKGQDLLARLAWFFGIAAASALAVGAAAEGLRYLILH